MFQFPSLRERVIKNLCALRVLRGKKTAKSTLLNNPADFFYDRFGFGVNAAP